MIASGLLPTFAIGAHGSQYLLGETYWSRGSRGTRSDFITYYDAHTLTAMAEVPLPEGRFLVTKRFVLQVSADGRFLFSANMTPATSVSVIDLAKRQRIAEISTPGCTLVLPHGSAFSSVCGNGSFLTVHLRADGSVEKKDRGEPFFNPDVDPVFDEWAFSRAGSRAFFASYHGRMYEVALATDSPQPARGSWLLTSEEERAAGWRPGGAQPVEYHLPSDRLFVLMHRGAEWTQFDSGTEVWIFDARTHRRLSRLQLSTPAQAIAVTRDNEPLLFTADGKSRMSTYRRQEDNWQHVADIDELGFETALLTVPEP
jgi:methylamine dehydrogenase heavy chain